MAKRKKHKDRSGYPWSVLRNIQNMHECPNCKEMTSSGHFCPPSLGDEGFYICTPPDFT